jgi:CHAT domain-containing protein
VRHSEACLSITRYNLTLAATAQSERQQIAAAASLRRWLNGRLSLPEPDASAGYRHVLEWKGAALVQQRRRRVFTALARREKDEAVLRLLRELEHVTSQLASRALAPVQPAALDARRRELEDLTRRKERLEADLSRRSADFRAWQKAPEVTPEMLQRALPAGVVLVDFLVYDHTDPTQHQRAKRHERRLAAFVVRKDRPVTRLDLGRIDGLAPSLAAWQKALHGAGPVPQKAARAVRKQVWEPLTRHLDGARTVLLSPDDLLTGVPFAALPGSKPGTYLLEELALAVVPVPHALAQPADAPVARGRAALLVVGGVDFQGEPGPLRPGAWAALPGTLREPSAVAALFRRRFPQGQTTRLEGREATRAAVRAALAGHNFAHLATHGFFAPPQIQSALARAGDEEGLFGREGVSGWHPGLLSGLVLAGANRPAKGGEEGILTALEVSELDLSGLDLAVLSACRTGLGAVAGGEGVLGLQRAFQVAGARSLVGSLWNVSDGATSVLMEEFYRRLWGAPKVSRLEALRQAQLHVLRNPDQVRRRASQLRAELAKQGRGDTKPALELVEGRQPPSRRSHPALWAAFVLSGDWR